MMNMTMNSNNSSNSSNFVDEEKVVVTHDPLGNYQVNMASTSQFSLTSWIIDTGATNHMTSNVGWLTDLIRCTSPLSSV